MFRNVVIGLVVLSVVSCIYASPTVKFSQDVYTINPGDPFSVDVVIDADDNTQELDSLSAGLYSMGFNISFDSAKANIADITDIFIVSSLNGDGTGGNPYKAISAGNAGCAGALDLSANEGYNGTLLATVTFQDTPSVPFEEYVLNLGFYFQGTQTNFMDFDGNTLDDSITFGSARIVPEPLSLSLLALGSLAVLRRKVIC